MLGFLVLCLLCSPPPPPPKGQSVGRQRVYGAYGAPLQRRGVYRQGVSLNLKEINKTDPHEALDLESIRSVRHPGKGQYHLSL